MSTMPSIRPSAILLTTAISFLILLLTPSSSAAPSSSAYKAAVCEVICRSERLPLAKRLCQCPDYEGHLDELLGGVMDKRWGLDMDLDQRGWTGAGEAQGFQDSEDDARKIFRFGKRGGAQKKWSMDDDLSMALPWDQLDGATMSGSEDDRAGGKIFRFGKKRSTRSAAAGSKAAQNKA